MNLTACLDCGGEGFILGQCVEENTSADPNLVFNGKNFGVTIWLEPEYEKREVDFSSMPHSSEYYFYCYPEGEPEKFCNEYEHSSDSIYVFDFDDWDKNHIIKIVDPRERKTVQLAKFLPSAELSAYRKEGSCTVTLASGATATNLVNAINTAKADDNICIEPGVEIVFDSGSSAISVAQNINIVGKAPGGLRPRPRIIFSGFGKTEWINLSSSELGLYGIDFFHEASSISGSLINVNGSSADSKVSLGNIKFLASLEANTATTLVGNLISVGSVSAFDLSVSNSSFEDRTLSKFFWSTANVRNLEIRKNYFGVFDISPSDNMFTIYSDGSVRQKIVNNKFYANDYTNIIVNYKPGMMALDQNTFYLMRSAAAIKIESGADMDVESSGNLFQFLDSNSTDYNDESQGSKITAYNPNGFQADQYCLAVGVQVYPGIANIFTNSADYKMDEQYKKRSNCDMSSN